ncbi:MAG TPA: hypothetical protein VK752_20640 [Bryobacteraceae bacterium]|jgi:hypothetical protein|nr:hypothetical protein [Bryobacteraceae bacterium]
MKINLQLCLFLAVASISLSADDVPSPLRSRFVLGDPVWKEIPVRPDLQNQYEKCWQSAINTLLDNHFDLASTDKDSGYIRTTENTGVVILKGDWGYKVQVSVKFSYLPADSKANPPTQGTVEKLRIQAAGIVAETKNGRLKHYLKGYDTEVLQNLFQDLQAKLGPR